VRRWLSAHHVSAAAKVAAGTTVVGAIIYVLVCGGLIVAARANSLQNVDRELQQHLHRGPEILLPGSEDHDHRALYGPSYLWRIGADGRTAASTPGAPVLPPSLRHVQGPVTASLDGTPFRLAGTRSAAGWNVLGISLASIDQTQSGLIVASALGLGPLLIVVFGAALLIGLRSVQPIERARRRLLEFTGDASHELRTPLQLIETELSVALRRRRDADGYRESLERISLETGHMRRLVDNLLWLARFDSRAGEQTPRPVELVEAASNAVARFTTVAAQRSLDLSLEVPEGDAPAVVAPPAWIERLLSVLIDNACRYTPEGGSVVVTVRAEDGTASLSVEDSGPGVPIEERQRIFDRFHRSIETPAGSGLGLAIADAIVRSSRGRWQVGSSPAGGAAFTVTWPAARRRPAPPIS
jgi:signal transduction histidine kinase